MTAAESKAKSLKVQSLKNFIGENSEEIGVSKVDSSTIKGVKYISIPQELRVSTSIFKKIGIVIRYHNNFYYLSIK